jgi:hypothetical protein
MRWLMKRLFIRLGLVPMGRIGQARKLLARTETNHRSDRGGWRDVRQEAAFHWRVLQGCPCMRLQKVYRAGGPNLRRAAAQFPKPPFPVLLPPRKQAKPCRCILSTIDTTPSCCRSHLPLHHISLDRGGGVVGVLHVCISRRHRHLRRWIGSDREEETARTTTSSTFC